MREPPPDMVFTVAHSGCSAEKVHLSGTYRRFVLAAMQVPPFVSRQYCEPELTTQSCAMDGATCSSSRMGRMAHPGGTGSRAEGGPARSSQRASRYRRKKSQ